SILIFCLYTYPPTTELYTLSLHDALPIFRSIDPENGQTQWQWDSTPPPGTPNTTTGGNTWMTGTYDPDLNLIYWGTGNPTPVLKDRKSTRLNSSHVEISYAVFCLKKKKKK